MRPPSPAPARGPGCRRRPPAPADMGDDGALAGDQPALRLHARSGRRRHAVAGEALVHLRAGQHLVRQAVQAGGGEGALEQRVVLRAAIDRAGGDQQRLAGRPLGLGPELVGAAQQRHVGRVLVVRQADDAADAVRGAHGVRDVEALQPQHALAAAGELPAGGAAHAAHADHDHVPLHPRTPPPRHPGILGSAGHGCLHARDILWAWERHGRRPPDRGQRRQGGSCSPAAGYR